MMPESTSRMREAVIFTPSQAITEEALLERVLAEHAALLHGELRIFTFLRAQPRSTGYFYSVGEPDNGLTRVEQVNPAYIPQWRATYSRRHATTTRIGETLWKIHKEDPDWTDYLLAMECDHCFHKYRGDKKFFLNLDQQTLDEQIRPYLKRNPFRGIVEVRS